MKSGTMLDLGGMTYEVEFISTSTYGGNQIVIELEDSRLLSEIAADFEGREAIVRSDTIRPEITTTYAGYTELIEIRRNQANGSVRLTLKKP